MGHNSGDFISVLVVDDHVVIRLGLAVFLSAFDDLRLVGQAATGDEAVKLCAAVQPDVVLMDLVMPGMNGVSATRAIHERWPGIRVIGLTALSEPKLVQEVLEAGAAACLLKDRSADELADAIRAVYHGTELYPGAFSFSHPGARAVRPRSVVGGVDCHVGSRNSHRS